MRTRWWWRRRRVAGGGTVDGGGASGAVMTWWWWRVRGRRATAAGRGAAVLDLAFFFQNSLRSRHTCAVGPGCGSRQTVVCWSIFAECFFSAKVRIPVNTICSCSRCASISRWPSGTCVPGLCHATVINWRMARGRRHGGESREEKEIGTSRRRR